MSIIPDIQIANDPDSLDHANEEEHNEIMGNEVENTWAYDKDPFEPSHSPPTDSDDSNNYYNGSISPRARVTPALSTHQPHHPYLNTKAPLPMPDAPTPNLDIYVESHPQWFAPPVVQGLHSPPLVPANHIRHTESHPPR
ncbi:hypothetical protein JB92DRAFT_3131819 [Gautieria morchelliformis]|nr:hypothetical protein JB92DRAFT_3131819 [Gautieria morchelliformis]